ncbi:MAG: AMP-binding protein [Desulfobacteraceae bacterium IS3]|nr:MAG: AMP-binding protein [Desulfobacteraceae bacterium IS3]
MNIANILTKTATFFPNAVAVAEGERNITYKQFDEESSRIAASLTQAGTSPGDHVALCAPNSYAWLAFYFGVIKAGAVAVTVASLLKKQELQPIIADCQPKIIFTWDGKLEELEEIRKQDYLKFIVSESEENTFERLLAKGNPNFKTVDRDRKDTAAVLYTGGTTGASKGVLLSHENLQTSVHNVAFNERSVSSDRSLCFLPLNHVFAQVHIMGSTVYSGGTLIIQPAFDMDKLLYAVQRLGATKVYSVPTVYIRLLALNDLEQRFASVRYCMSAAATMAAEVVKAWKSRTGLDIHEAYGMTESAAMVTFNHYYRHVVGSVGTPPNLVEVQIRDADGNILPTGKEGEICICGPNIMKGYLGRPEETAASFWGPWFRSGDVGMLDNDGYLYIVDRLKDLIITGGENVYPREIEELLYTRGEVQECAVVGLSDKEYGERVVAVIVPKENQNVDPQAIKAFLKEQLAPYKIPKAYIELQEMPKSNTGKILKREIKKLLSET